MFEYKCFHDDYGDEWIPKTYLAEKPSKAKYQHACYLYRELNFGDSIWDMLKNIKVKKVGSANITYFFKDNDTWESTKKWRGLDFAYLGMTVDVCGKKGVIVGGNRSLNLNVLFDYSKETQRIDNCHPWYETTFYDNKGDIIRDYKKESVKP